jgi:hypothetical protein
MIRRLKAGVYGAQSGTLNGNGAIRPRLTQLEPGHSELVLHTQAELVVLATA